MKTCPTCGQTTPKDNPSGKRPTSPELITALTTRHTFPPGSRAIAGIEALEIITRAVCEHYHVTIPELCGHTRPWRIVLPRFVAIELIARHTTYNIATIAILFERTGCAISYARRFMANHLASYPEERAAFETLETQIKNA